MLIAGRLVAGTPFFFGIYTYIYSCSFYILDRQLWSWKHAFLLCRLSARKVWDRTRHDSVSLERFPVAWSWKRGGKNPSCHRYCYHMLYTIIVNHATKRNDVRTIAAKDRKASCNEFAFRPRCVPVRRRRCEATKIPPASLTSSTTWTMVESFERSLDLWYLGSKGPRIFLGFADWHHVVLSSELKHWDEGFCCSGVLLYQKMFGQFIRSSRFWCHEKLQFQVCAFLLLPRMAFRKENTSGPLPLALADQLLGL